MAPLMIAKLEYGILQDWNTDPGDVDNLMRHCRYELGLWYGWKLYGLKALVALHKQGETSTLPRLYLSGDQSFAFSADERDALKQYLLEGASLVSGATLGSPAF